MVVNASGQTLGAASRTALLPWIVPSPQFAGAVTWNSTAYQISTLLGPAVGGLLLSTSVGRGVPVALACVVLLRVLALVAICRLRVVRPERKQSVISLETLAAGVRFVWQNKPVLATMSIVIGGVGAILVVLGCAATWPQLLSVGSLANLRPAEPLDASRQPAKAVAA